MKHIVVVGGGPAGLGLAIEARLAGLAVTVVERCGGPVDKACGEGLMPDGVARLARLGVTPAAWGTHPFRGIRYISGDTVAEADFPDGVGLGVRRLALSEALRARALALDVVILERVEAISLTETAGGVTLLTSAGPLHADVLVGADGLHSQVRKWAGISATVGPGRRLGIRRHFTVKPWSAFVEVWWSDGVEAYVTPVGPERVGVAFLWSGGKGDYDTFMRTFPALAARLGPPESPVRGAGPFDVRVQTQHKGRVVLIGDAAGYVDALTGEGIALALEQAEALVGLIAAGTLDRWPKVYARLTRRHRWFTRALLLIARRPWARRLMVRALSALPAMFRTALWVNAPRRAAPMLPGR